MQSSEQTAPAVFKAIVAVQGELAKTGIAKSRRNQQQGYQFRGIDEVYGALAPLLAAHGLCILPRVLSREVTERATAKGGTLFYVVVDVEFDLVAASDGSKHTIRTIGEAMDSADKATNKAMSAAYKYAAFMAFAIPTEGDNDADSTTHELAPKIDAKQCATLRKLLADADASEEAFCSYLKVGTLPELAADNFERAQVSLQRRIAAMEKQKADPLADEIPY